MSPDHQSIALALYLGACIRERMFAGKMRMIVTFVKPRSRAPFTYGLKLVEPYVYDNDGVETIVDAIAQDIPNYPMSLDALHKVENQLFTETAIRIKYANFLVKRTENGPDARWYIKWLATNTSPAKKLEAILRTINLYGESQAKP